MLSRLAVIVIYALSLSACTVSKRVVFEDSEGVVSESFFSSIKKNRTHREWILDNLGEPRTRQDGPNEASFYSYHLKRSHYRKLSLLFFMRYQGSSQDSEYFHVMMCGDTVKKTWWDSFALVQLETELKRAKCRAPKLAELEQEAINTELISTKSSSQHANDNNPAMYASDSPNSMDKEGEDFSPSEPRATVQRVTTEDL